jgi:GxxExxY protein
MTTDHITSDIIGCVIEIHKNFGPGLLEKAYQEFLCYDLSEMGYFVEKEKYLPVTYKGVQLDLGYRTDLIIEEEVVVEIKRVEKITDVHMAQILTYMKLGGHQLGLILNFQTKMMKNGIKRFVL